MKDESNTKKLTQDANKMESNTNIKTKVCKECGRELPIESFQRQVRSSDGYMHICKECKSKRVLAGFSKASEEFKQEEIKEINKRGLVQDIDPFFPLEKFRDIELVSELRDRGWTVTCTKVIEL